MNGEKRNLPASIHQRLLNKSHETGRSFNELLHIFHSSVPACHEPEFRKLFVPRVEEVLSAEEGSHPAGHYNEDAVCLYLLCDPYSVNLLEPLLKFACHPV